MSPELLHRLALGLAAFLTVMTAVLLVGGRHGNSNRMLNERLQEIATQGRRESMHLDSPRDPQLPHWFRRIVGESLAEMIFLINQRTGSHQSPMVPIAQSVGLGLIGLLVAVGIHLYWLAIPLSLALGAIPLIVVALKANRRCKLFTQQYGQVLDFLARSMRTGHDLMTSMRMVSEEFPEPIGTEFKRALEEVNLGMPLEDAISRMAQRVSCDDLGYFIACVAIQKETGGSLALSMSTLAQTIRERFKFMGKVKALTSQGRLSAITLCVLPLLVLTVLYTTAPDYISVFWTTDNGRLRIISAAALLVIGIVWVFQTVRMRL
jgi:tight adherence protein B